MPRISVVDTWTLPEGSTPNLSETNIELKADVVYRIVTEDNGNAQDLLMTVKNVRNSSEEPFVLIVPNVIFGDGTFWYPEERDIVLSKTIKSIEKVYISRKSLDRRPRPQSKDPYSFEFFSTKSNRNFNIKVDENQLISVTVKTNRGNGSYNYLGHIREYADGKITLQCLQNSNGVFYIEDVQINVQDLKGIYFYELFDIPYDEGVARREARKERAAARQKAKEQKNAKAETPEAEAEAVVADAEVVEDATPAKE